MHPGLRRCSAGSSGRIGVAQRAIIGSRTPDVPLLAVVQHTDAFHRVKRLTIRLCEVLSGDEHRRWIQAVTPGREFPAAAPPPIERWIGEVDRAVGTDHTSLGC